MDAIDLYSTQPTNTAHAVRQKSCKYNPLKALFAKHPEVQETRPKAELSNKAKALCDRISLECRESQ
jgi:hypothetical protein